MKRQLGQNFVLTSCFSLLLSRTSTRIPSTFAFKPSEQSLSNTSPLFRKSTTPFRNFHFTQQQQTYHMTTTASNENTGSQMRFHEIVEKDGKQGEVTSTLGLAAKLLVVVPLWMTLVLPLTIFYQGGKAVMGVFKGKSKNENDDNVESTTNSTPLIVDPSNVIPRPERKFDLVVLGATGFTGGLAVRHLAKTYGAGNSGKVKWAIAGRSQAKLNSVLQKLATELNMPELTKEGAVDTIICDTSDPTMLPSLVRNTRAVATTAGPFTLYGKGVVEACSKYGTHYTDITGETSFVKLMKSKYQKDAQKSGARIVSLCGNDSIPWDLSYNLLADELKARGESLEKVEFADEFRGSASGGTLKTMFMAVSGQLDDLEPKCIDAMRWTKGSDQRHSAEFVNAINNGITSGVPKPWNFNGKNSNGSNDDTLVEAPFVMSAVNYEAVGWSHALREDPECSYKEQQLVPDFKTALDGILTLIMFFTSIMNPLTGKLIEKAITQPGDGPDLKSMENNYFLAVTGTAFGSKGSIVQSLLYYNKDPGYLETARMVVESALCLSLEEKAVSQTIGSNEGGFFAPGYCLRKNLLQRLVDTGCHYEVRVVQEASK